MKFIKNVVPVFTGIENIKGILNNIHNMSKQHIASVKTGIPCLVVNGEICDESGVPIQNSELQSKFDWFSERVQKCKAVAVCTIYADDDVKTFKNTYNHSIYKYVYGADYFKRMSGSLKLELLDIIPNNAPLLSYRYRMEMAKSISRRSDNDNSTITMPEWIGSYEKSNEEIINFIISSSKLGNLVMISDIESKFNYEYSSDLIPKRIKVDAFEIISAKIKTIRSGLVKNDSISKDPIRVCDFVRVELMGKPLSISMLNTKPFASNRFLNAFESGMIDKIKFRCIIEDGIPSHPTQL